MVMNPLAPIVHLHTLKEKSPIAVHFSYIEPMEHPIPKEVGKRYFRDESQNLITSYVGLENFTSKVLKDIRVKLKSPLGFDPILESSERGKSVGYSYDKITNEILIKSIDPSESIYLNLFPLPSKLVDDFEPQVIIDDQLLTRGMKRMGYYHKYPSYGLLQIFIAVLMVFSVALAFFGTNIIEYIRGFDSGYVLVQQAEARIKENGCVLKPIKVGSDIDWYIERSPMPYEYTFSSNGVSGYKELTELPEVVLCLPVSVNM